MKKKIIYTLLSINFVISIFSLIRGNADYNKLKNGNPPIFADEEVGYSDGGSSGYIGYFYEVRNLNRFSRLPMPEWANDNDAWAHDVGYEIHFDLPWLWWCNKSESKTIINQDMINKDNLDLYLKYKQIHNLE